MGTLDGEGRFAGANGSVRDMTEQDRLERELRVSEERYRFLVEKSPDIIWATDASGVVTYMSATVARVLGRQPDAVIGRHYGELLPEGRWDSLMAHWEALLREPEREQVMRVEMRHADGRLIPFELSVVGRAEGGRLLALQGVAREVTVRERLERELRESEARFRQLVQTTPDAIWRADADGNFLFMADSAETLFGWPAKDLLGKHFGFLTAAESLPRANEEYRALSEDPDTVHHVPLTLVRRDGSTFAGEVTMIGVTEDGRFAGGQGTVRDVSERERLGRELRESEERYRFLVENSPDIVFSTDAEGRYTYYSETVERLTGWRSGELLGQHFSSLIEPSSFPDAAVAWQRFVEDPTQMQVHRFALRHRDGQLMPVEVNAIGITDEDGRFGGIHGAARDVSERERLERDLRRQAGEIASGEERAHLARELHDSVTQALFSMTLLTRTIEMLLDRDPVQARNQLGALRELQREALAEMRALIFELRPGNLEQDGLYKALRTHTAALQGRIGLPIVVDAQFEDRLPIAIEEVLYRIAQEALHNVVKHAAAREVRLELRRHDGEVRLRIVDDGKGFDPGAVPDAHLGLAGMRARADKIDGRLEVHSRPGAGTTIEVIVPAAVIDAARNGLPDPRGGRAIEVTASAE